MPMLLASSMLDIKVRNKNDTRMLWIEEGVFDIGTLEYYRSLMILLPRGHGVLDWNKRVTLVEKVIGTTYSFTPTLQQAL